MTEWSRHAIGEVLENGDPIDAGDASVSLFDATVYRGIGCFEAMRSYHGVVFRLDRHLDRLERSAAALAIGLPERRLLELWSRDRAHQGGDCVVRIIATGGDILDGTRSRVFVFAHATGPVPTELAIEPRVASWHAAGTPGELVGAKTLSYAVNMASTRAARDNGFDDALLLSNDGIVLEGPTFSIGWFDDEGFHTPTLDLGILESVTRGAVIDALSLSNVRVHQSREPLDNLLAAAEVCAMSTVREVLPVVRVGEVSFGAGDQTRDLAIAFSRLVADETGQ